MSFSPVPKYMFKKITGITPAFLLARGITFLMLDLDNTIASYAENGPSDEIILWADKMQECGVTLFIVSNNRHSDRVAAFARAMEVEYVMHARKPSPLGLKTAMKAAGKLRTESALAGDQVYTDVLAANRAGVVSICVEPIAIGNPLFAVRYGAELPFRAACKNVIRNGSGNE